MFFKSSIEEGSIAMTNVLIQERYSRLNQVLINNFKF